MRRSTILSGLMALLLTAPVAAADLGYRGWGVRIGLGDDPDQLLGGVHVDFGEFTRHLRFQPAFELGLGDDHTILSLTAPVHYRFPVDSRVRPYAGGGVFVAFIDRDLPPRVPRRARSESELEIGFTLLGGVEWPVRGGNVSVEVGVNTGDTHDVKLLAGWTF